MAACAALIAACGASSQASEKSKSGSDPIHLGVFIQPSTTDGALDLGMMKGLNITQVTEASGGAALPLIASGQLTGQADIAALPVVLAINHAVPVKAVFLGAVLSDFLIVRKDIHSLKQLEGQKLAAPVGSISTFQMQAYLASHGVDISKVDWVNLAPTSIVAAFKTGAIAGTDWSPPVTTNLVAAGGRVVDVEPVPTYTVMSTAFINAHPATVQKFVCDLASAQDAFLRNPEAFWQAQSKQLNLPVSELKTILPAADIAPGDEAAQPQWSMLGPKSLQHILFVGQSMAKAGLISPAPTLAQVKAIIDQRFAAAAAAGKCA